MNPRNPFLAVSFSAGLLALVLSGCSSLSNRTSSPDTFRPAGGKSLSILQLRDNVKATRLALNRTTDALGQIPGSSAPRQAFDAFAMANKDFEKLAEKTLKEASDVRNQGRELFAEWGGETESIIDPQIRAVAEDRRVNLQRSYNTMLTPLNTARSDLNQVRSDLTDVQKALALDLTPGGIEAAKPAIDRITQQTATSVQSLDSLAVQLDQIAEALPPSTIKTTK